MANMEIISSEDAANELGISVITLRKHCQDGKLGTKFGNSWLITRQELEEFKKNRRKPGRPKKEE